MKFIATTLITILCVATACLPENISNEDCDIEKFPFSHFQHITSEFGEFRKALEVEESGFVVFLVGAQTNLVRFTNDLEVLWVGSYDFEFIHSDLLQNNQGGYTILGTTSEETVLLKIDSLGGLSDQKKIGNTQARQIKQIVADGKGGVIAVGTKFEGSSKGKSSVMRIDSTQELVWEKSFNNFDSESALSIVAEGNDEFSVLNSFTGISFGSSAYINKVDIEGRILDSREVLKNTRRSQRSLLQLCSDGLKVLATTDSKEDFFNEDIFLAKLDKRDSISWYTFTGGQKAEAFGSMIQAKDGGFIIVGTTSSCSSLSQALYLAKVGSDGVALWERVYGGSYQGEKSIIENTRGEFIIITSSQENNSLIESTTQVLRIDQEGRPI